MISLPSSSSSLTSFLLIIIIIMIPILTPDGQPARTRWGETQWAWPQQRLGVINLKSSNQIPQLFHVCSLHYVSCLNRVSPIKLVLPVLTGRCWRKCNMVSVPSGEMWPMLVCIGGHHYHQRHHHHCHDRFETKVWPWSPDHLSLLPDRHHSFKPSSILPTGETRFSRVAVCNL